MSSKYHVVRLDYGVRNHDGNYHQTHRFTSHRTLEKAIESATKLQSTYNCVDIVDDKGVVVDTQFPAPEGA